MAGPLDWLDGSASGSIPEGEKLPPQGIATYAWMAGVRDKEARTIAVAVALAESGGDPTATNQNTDQHRSTDYGLWQINGYWHPEYSKEELLTPGGNARAMAEISKNGTDWSQWVTYTSGRYEQYMEVAAGAATTDVSAAGYVADNLPGWLEGAMGLVLAGVFSIAGLAIVAIGLSKITGMSPAKTMPGLSTAAAAAALVA